MAGSVSLRVTSSFSSDVGVDSGRGPYTTYKRNRVAEFRGDDWSVAVHWVRLLESRTSCLVDPARWL